MQGKIINFWEKCKTETVEEIAQAINNAGKYNDLFASQYLFAFARIKYHEIIDQIKQDLEEEIYGRSADFICNGAIYSGKADEDAKNMILKFLNRVIKKEGKS